MMITKIISADHPNAIKRALELIRSGKLVAFPTDTVYGLGAQAFSLQAIQKLFQVKNREPNRAIPILMGGLDQLDLVTVSMGYMELRLAEVFWPGPLTLVVPRHPSLPDIIAPGNTIGIRMPDHPLALSLLGMSGPLATTSANLSGASSPQTAQEVRTQLNRRIPLILDGGRTPGGVPSTVVSCTDKEPVVLRPGPIGMDDLLRALE
jgi:L-threonylcarbamoyladenylate synthase